VALSEAIETLDEVVVELHEDLLPCHDHMLEDMPPVASRQDPLARRTVVPGVGVAAVGATKPPSHDLSAACGVSSP
jgi:hypothetical protein